MNTIVGTIDIGLRMEYLDSVLTSQAQKEGSISLTQFIKIHDFTYNKEEHFVMFDCELFEQLLN